MRWEITVTTHLFVTCRTGFYSAGGEVASRAGRGGRERAGAGPPAHGCPAGPAAARRGPPSWSASVRQPEFRSFEGSRGGEGGEGAMLFGARTL